MQNTHADFVPHEDDVIEYEFFPDEFRKAVITTDSGNHRVQVFDIYGDFLFKFGGQVSNKSQFNGHRGVTFSQKGYIVVAVII